MGTLKIGSAKNMVGVTIDPRTVLFNDNNVKYIKSDLTEIWSHIKPLVPIMTSYDTPYGEVIYDSEYTVYKAYKVFNGTNNGAEDSWLSGLTAPTVQSPHYIGYKSQTPCILKKVRVANRNSSDYGEPTHHSIKDVIVQGSNDGVKWDNLVSYTNNVTDMSAVWEIDVSFNSTPYYSYRLLITSMNDTGWVDKYVSVGQLQFYGSQLKGLLVPMTTYSNEIGTVSASTEYTINGEKNLAYSSFGTDDTTKFWFEGAEGTQTTGGYLQFMFNKPTTLNCIKYRMGHASSKTFTVRGKIQYTVNGIDWLDVENSEIEHNGSGMGELVYNYCNLTKVLGIRFTNTYKSGTTSFAIGNVQVYR